MEGLEGDFGLGGESLSLVERLRQGLTVGSERVGGGDPGTTGDGLGGRARARVRGLWQVWRLRRHAELSDRLGRTKGGWAAQHSQEQVEEERKTKKNTWGHKHAEK